MENVKRQKSKYLVCGCCGAGFETWDGYQDQDQDVGFGICKECQDIAEKREYEFVEDAIKQMTPHMKPENQEKIKKMTKEQKHHLVSNMIDKGVLKWQIGK